MVERDTFVTVADGDQLNENYFNGIEPAMFKHAGSDQTAATVTGTTAETEIGEVSIAANLVTTGILVIATGTSNLIASASDGTATIKLYGGTSATATSNTEFKSTVRTNATTAAGSANTIDLDWTMVFYISTLTWTSTNYINITATLSSVSQSSTCESIEIIYL